jgi:hypothetical protein
MNSRPRNFLFFPWQQVANNGQPQLRNTPPGSTR